MYQHLQLKKNFQSSFSRFQFEKLDIDKYTSIVPLQEIHHNSLLFPDMILEINSYLHPLIPTDKLKQNFSPYFSAISSSTYPYNKQKEKRDGEPICDKYRVLVSPNCIITALADGCNWGKQPCEAASRATKSFIDFISKNRFKAKTTNDLAKFCLQGIQMAHNAIIYKKFNEKQVGTTTLLGGILIRLAINDDPSLSPKMTESENLDISIIKNLDIQNSLEKRKSDGEYTNIIVENNEELNLTKHQIRKISSPPSYDFVNELRDKEDIIPPIIEINLRQNDNLSLNLSEINSIESDYNTICISNENRIRKWAFVVANIGDCKAYIWKNSTKEIELLLDKSREENPLDPTDCGGRIGPFIEHNFPDLRNLTVNFRECEEGDIIFLCSDGIYDNFDPELLGKDPLKFGFQFDKWQDMDVVDVSNCKNNYQIKKISKLLNNSLTNHKKIEKNDSSGSENSDQNDKENNTEDSNCNKSEKIDIKSEKEKGDDNTVDDINFNPQYLVEKLIDHCFNVTESARKFLEENNRKLPKDYQKYPGKMDHSTIVAFRVGDMPIMHTNLVNQMGCSLRTLHRTIENKEQFVKKKTPRKRSTSMKESLNESGDGSHHRTVKKGSRKIWDQLLASSPTKLRSSSRLESLMHLKSSSNSN